MKKIQKILIFTFLLFPVISSALSIAPNYCPQLINNMWMGNWYNNPIEVRELQTFLYEYYGLAGQYKATGYYGKVTRSLITKFQREHNVSATGGVGPITRSLIASKCNNVSPDPIACTMQYEPICGQEVHACCKASGIKPAFCTYAKVNCEAGEQKTFGNLCELNAAGAKYLYAGECKNNQSGEAPINCKIWYDGCNTCSRQYTGGPMMCTLMACFQNSGAYCKEYFSGSTNEVPVIKSFSGPTQLNLNQIGTWKVEVSIFNNQQLTYNITWGDEHNNYKIGMPVLSTISAVTPQNTTFEHSYSNPGTYTVTITVTAANGLSTKTTSTVNVIY